MRSTLDFLVFSGATELRLPCLSESRESTDNTTSRVETFRPETVYDKHRSRDIRTSLIDAPALCRLILAVAGYQITTKRRQPPETMPLVRSTSFETLYENQHLLIFFYGRSIIVIRTSGNWQHL